MRKITHEFDPEIGHFVQVVSPEELRRVLDADGEDYSRPSNFGPEDEWDVGLRVRKLHDEFVVWDGQGGVWWPSEEAQEEIAEADNPRVAALRMCYDQPYRGVWKN